MSSFTAAAIVFGTAQSKYIFVKQFRYSVETELLEVVAGIVEDDDPEKTILKETEEETGYKTDHIEHVWDFFTSPGACTEVVNLYYAEVSAKTAEGGGLDNEHEQIEIVTLNEEELFSHPLRDAKTIIAMQ